MDTRAAYPSAGGAAVGILAPLTPPTIVFRGIADPEVRCEKSGSDSGCLPMRHVSGHAILFVSGHPDRDTRERTS
jgi:hypothetical protein